MPFLLFETYRFLTLKYAIICCHKFYGMYFLGECYRFGEAWEEVKSAKSRNGGAEPFEWIITCLRRTWKILRFQIGEYSMWGATAAQEQL